MGVTNSKESQHGTELVQGAVYEFHKPDPGERMQVEIVFMHGLQVIAGELKDAYYKTWTTADGKEVWPETWLKDKYPNARILSLAYDSSARKTGIAGNMGPYLLSQNLLDEMVSSAANIGQNDCPVVFVGHSLGGLIAKEVVVRCTSDPTKVEYKNLLKNLKAVFFYATPHGGSELADSLIGDLADALPHVDRSSLVGYLKPLQMDRTYTHDNFCRALSHNDCKFYVVAEGRETRIAVLRHWVVRETSAHFPGLSEYTPLPNADHFTVCKPQTKEDAGYLKFTSCVDQVITEYRGRTTVEPSVEDPIGIEDKIHEISELLERSGVSMVFLFGMEGAGKTTLSKEVYNRKAFKYTKSCFLENVKSKNIEDVRRELLRGLCGVKLDPHEPVQKHHLDMIRTCLLEQRVLVVIDDVISEEHLEKLQVFHALETASQSTVVVTGPDQAVVPKEYVNSGKAVIAPVHGIRDREGSDLKLFLRYALDGVPQADKAEVETELLGDNGEAKEIVRLCNGLPLSLEVLGKYLGNTKYTDLQQLKEIWAEAFERLQKAQSINGNKSEKLWSSLLMSYDNLDDVERKLFLDFACVFSEIRQVDTGLVERIWDSATGVQNLIDKSLLKVKGKRYVMHDQLRDMGRNILLKEALKDDGLQFPIYLVHGYKPHSETHIKFKELSREQDVPYIASFEEEGEKTSQRYSKLRLLSITGCDTPSLVDDCLLDCSRKLRWVHLKKCLSVTKIGMRKLCSFGDLRVLQISHCDNIVELPEDVGKLVHLAQLEVTDCHNLRSLPDTLGKLKELKRLEISWSGLLAVPASVGQLSTVEYLSFEGCDQLTAIVGTQICTQNLVELKLPIVPTTCLPPCPHLQRLFIENGQGVTKFPQDFFKTSMPKLKVIKCSNVQVGEVELNNPDGSPSLVVSADKPFQITHLELSRHSNGSISHLIRGKTHYNFLRACKSHEENGKAI